VLALGEAIDGQQQEYTGGHRNRQAKRFGPDDARPEPKGEQGSGDGLEDGPALGRNTRQPLKRCRERIEPDGHRRIGFKDLGIEMPAIQQPRVDGDEPGDVARQRDGKVQQHGRDDDRGEPEGSGVGQFWHAGRSASSTVKMPFQWRLHASVHVSRGGRE
jgi:hypothetical protein